MWGQGHRIWMLSFIWDVAGLMLDRGSTYNQTIEEYKANSFTTTLIWNYVHRFDNSFWTLLDHLKIAWILVLNAIVLEFFMDSIWHWPRLVKACLPMHRREPFIDEFSLLHHPWLTSARPARLIISCSKSMISNYLFGKISKTPLIGNSYIGAFAVFIYKLSRMSSLLNYC